MPTDKPTLVVTGASGFLATEILRIASGWRVVALSRSMASKLPNADETFQCDYEDERKLAQYLSGATAVIHTSGLAHVFGSAANDETAFMHANADATAALARAARAAGIPHLILISSVAVYGPRTDGLVDETHPCNPESPYARSKYRAEQLARAALAGSFTALTVLRVGTIYGEGDRGNVRKLILAVKRRRFIWVTPGLNRKSLIYKEDAALGCLLAASTPPDEGLQRTFNLSAFPVSMKEIVTCICAALGQPHPRIALPPFLFRGAVALFRALCGPGGFTGKLQTFARDDAYSSLLFERTFSFRPAMTLAEGISRQIKGPR